MYIERLSFADNATYNPLEAAVHTARYLSAKPFCFGKRVLDISCGEGYGAHLMAEAWGAESVDALDLSPDAIDRAKATFSSSKIRWYCHNAEEALSLLSPNQYDLIVSLETIEHLRHPERFLEGLRQLLKPGGIVVLSCPNDYWYYPDAERSNPFHFQKLRFEEFQELAERFLGTNVQYQLGLPVAGFGNVPLAKAKRPVDLSVAEATFSQLDSHPLQLMVPPTDAIDPSNCSYFIGIWGAGSQESVSTSSVFVQSMDQAYMTLVGRLYEARDEAGLQAAHAAERLATLELERDALQAEIVSLKEAITANHLQPGSAQSRLNILQAECEYYQEEMLRATAELTHLRQEVALARASWFGRFYYLLKKVYHKLKSLRGLLRA